MVDDKNFPVIFGRRGGGSIDILSSLESIDIIEKIDQLAILDTRIQEKKEAIIAILYKQIKENTTTDGKLLNLKRDLYNNKNIKKYLKFISSKQLVHLLGEYIDLKESFKLEIENFDTFFDPKFNNFITELTSLGNSDFLKNGLLFASHSLFNASQKKESSQNQLNKKNKKYLVSILKYLSRSTTKTTPFSTFNTLFFLEKTDQENYKSTPQKIQYAYQLNNLLLYYLEEALMEYPAFRKDLQITINKNLWQEQEASFHFYINKKNNESFKKIESAPILKFIYDKVQERRYTYQGLINLISETISETPETVNQYLEAVLKEGFLILKFPSSPRKKEWAESLKRYLENLEQPNAVFSSLTKVLTTLETCRKNLDQNTICEKKAEIENCYHDFSNCIDVLKEDSLFSKKVLPQDLFYEDVMLHIDDSIEQSQYDKLSNSLKKIYHYFGELSYKRIVKRELTAFLTPNNKKLSLLKFYQEIYLKHHATIHVNDSDLVSLQALLQYFNTHQEEIENSERIDLSTFLPDTDHQINDTFGAYIQFIDKDKTSAILNGFSKSSGANSSRFLNFCSRETIHQIKDQNKDHSHIITDVTDASYHNSNIYPTISQNVITLCHDKQLVPEQEQIALTDLFVVLDEKDKLIIVNNDNKKIIPIQFSLESLQRKSKLAQFLDLFDPADNFGYSLYLEKINTFFLNKLKNNSIVKIPRLYFGNQMLIQRKKWLVKKDVFTEILEKEKTSLALTYYHIYKWAKAHGIPNEVFITVQEKKVGVSKSNHYKPQYINFKMPIYVLLLQDILKNADTVITITEMSPNTEEVKATGGFVKEYIINI